MTYNKGKKMFKVRVFNKLVILFLLMLSLSNLKSQSYHEIGTIEINPSELANNYKLETVEFLSASKKSFGKFLCFRIHDIIEPYIKDLSEPERKKLIIICIDTLPNIIITTYYDYDEKTTKIPPFLIHRKVIGNVGDTVVAYELKNRRGKIDLRPVQKELEQIVELRVYLQFKNLAKNDEKIIFQPGTVIYPQDQQSVRWLNNIKYLKLYIVK
jgi:hypothetical protein